MDKFGETQAYDAFGEKSPPPRPRRGTAIGARARAVPVAVFWSVALLLVAGRIHFAPSTAPAVIELAAR